MGRALNGKQQGFAAAITRIAHVAWHCAEMHIFNGPLKKKHAAWQL